MAEEDQDIVEELVEGDEFEGELQDGEDEDNWQARREAVSDENYEKAYDAFQLKMQELNERELVIEREQKLLEMQEKMRERELQIRKAEKDLAAKSSLRYESLHVIDDLNEREFETGKWVDSQNRLQSTGTHAQQTIDTNARVVNFKLGANSQTIGKSGKGHNSANKAKGVKVVDSKRDSNYAIAETLVNEEFLQPCRTSGTSRLNTLGLSKQKSDSRLLLGKGRQVAGGLTTSSTLRGATGGPTFSTSKAGASKPTTGANEDGESMFSFATKLSGEAGRSDISNPKTKVKSGMYDKIADEVILKLKWPHKRLSRVWVPERVQPNQMTFEQVVAGEIAIILRSENPEEVRCRLHILQKLAYWNMQGQPWQRVRDIYMAILHSIEEGEANFQSTFNEYDQVFPVKQISKGKTFNKRDVFWCREYNRETCALDSGHKATIAGTERTVLHICAACWKLGKREKHRDSDPGCPQKEL